MWRCGKLFGGRGETMEMIFCLLRRQCDVSTDSPFSFLSSSPLLTMASASAASLRPLRHPNSYAFATTSLPHAIWLVIAATLTIPGANAYSWNFRSKPQQCQDMDIELTGDGGQPPFRILVVPYGASPLPNNTEARTISEQVFARGSDTSGSVQMKFPANSQFVAVVSLCVHFVVNVLCFLGVG